MPTPAPRTIFAARGLVDRVRRHPDDVRGPARFVPRGSPTLQGQGGGVAHLPSPREDPEHVFDVFQHVVGLGGEQRLARTEPIEYSGGAHPCGTASEHVACGVSHHQRPRRMDIEGGTHPQEEIGRRLVPHGTPARPLDHVEIASDAHVHTKSVRRFGTLRGGYGEAQPWMQERQSLQGFDDTRVEPSPGVPSALVVGTIPRDKMIEHAGIGVRCCRRKDLFEGRPIDQRINRANGGDGKVIEGPTEREGNVRRSVGQGSIEVEKNCVERQVTWQGELRRIYS